MSPVLRTKRVAWADSPLTVYEQRSTSISIPHVIPFKGANLKGSTRDSHNFTTSVFSTQIRLVSAPINASAKAMKLKSGQPSASVLKPPSKLGKFKNVSPTLYDDPAFSPDPYSNPLFVTSHEPLWASPPPAGHPSLKSGARRPAHLNTSSLLASSVAMDASKIPVPPNSPMSPDAPNGPQSAFPFISPANYPPSRPSPTAPSTSSNTPSPPPSTTLPRALPEPVESPADKKPRIVSLISAAASVLSPLKHHDRSSSQPAPPPYEATMPTSRPLHARNASAQEVRPAVARPVLPSRPATVDTAQLPAQRKANERRVMTDLDRIDELDETNPLGLSLHHRGPYEAIQQLVQRGQQPKVSPYNVGGRYQNAQGSSHAVLQKSHMPPSSRISPPETSYAGASLNLAPGQILPPGLHPHSSYPQPRPHATPLQTSPLRENSHSFDLTQQQQKPQRVRRIINLDDPVPEPPKHTVAQPVQPATTQPRTDAGHGTDQNHSFDFRATGGEQVEHNPYEGGPQGVKSPGRDSFQQGHPQRPQTNPAHQGPYYTKGIENRRVGGRGPIPGPQDTLETQNSPISNVNRENTPRDNRSSLQQNPNTGLTPPQPHYHQARSFDHSMSSGSSATESRNGRMPHYKPRFLPKRLVMPAPLQPSSVVSPKAQPLAQLHPPPRTEYHTSFTQQSKARPPSPPMLLPPILGSHADVDSLLGRDMPGGHGRKVLRKRVSINNNIPMSRADWSPPATGTVVSFDTSGWEEPHSAPLANFKLGKASRKVLSKKRNDD